METGFIRTSRPKNGKKSLLDNDGKCATSEIPCSLGKNHQTRESPSVLSQSRTIFVGKATLIARYFPTGDYHPGPLLFRRAVVGKISTWCGCRAVKWRSCEKNYIAHCHPWSAISLAHLHLRSLRKQLPCQQGLLTTIVRTAALFSLSRISTRSTWLLTLTMMCPG